METKELNKNLRVAKEQKNDEFYTRLEDIQDQMKNFRPENNDGKCEFFGKVIYCNCDDPETSNFFQYFKSNFENFQLKKLISTCYNKDGGHGRVIIYNRPNELPFTEELEGNGDFRSPECVKLLEESDIVVTNPPFSLFREYVAQLIEYKKKFLIIGNKNAITYKEIFPLFRDNKMWLGRKFKKGNAFFTIPDGADTSKYAKGVFNPKDRTVKFRNCAWFTNIDIKKRHERIEPLKEFDPEKYKVYDNYDAINVDKTNDIPDYDGVMGVPITFLDKYNPDQFTILGMAKRWNTSSLRTKYYTAKDSPDYGDLNAGPVIKIGNVYKKLYPRVLIIKKPF